jgi:DNA-binding CsgD family transcriptional regulator
VSDDDIAKSGLPRSPNCYPKDVAVAQAVATDGTAWTSFLAGLRPLVKKVATDWCHRLAPASTCLECAPGCVSVCLNFSDYSETLAGSIRSSVLKAYTGQAELPSFIEALVGSNWWFRDHAKGQEDNGLALPSAEHDPYWSDRVHAWAILADSQSAWGSFLHSFTPYLEKAAVKWCHRSLASRVCGVCKPASINTEHGCDAFSDAYTYILQRFRRTALAAYGGRTSLRSFVFLCLHDDRWWASFVQAQTGKIRIPVALQDEPTAVQSVYRWLTWGWDNERIANELQASLQTVGAMRELIDSKLRSSGRTVVSRRPQMVPLPETSRGSEEDEPAPRIPEPSSSSISPDVRAEGAIYWSKLSKQDHDLLRLAGEGYSVAKIASVLGVRPGQLWTRLYRLRKEIPKWFKM